MFGRFAESCSAEDCIKYLMKLLTVLNIVDIHLTVIKRLDLSRKECPYSNICQQKKKKELIFKIDSAPTGRLGLDPLVVVSVTHTLTQHILEIRQLQVLFTLCQKGKTYVGKLPRN